MAKPRPDAQPAEPAERAAIARAALQERAAELRAETPEAPGDSAAAPPRDPAADKASLATVLEVAVNGGARLVAWKFPPLAPVAAAVIPKAQRFAEGVAELFGAAAGAKFPRLLPALGGICGMATVALRMMALPQPPVVVEEKPSAPPAPDFSGGAS